MEPEPLLHMLEVVTLKVSNKINNKINYKYTLGGVGRDGGAGGGGGRIRSICC